MNRPRVGAVWLVDWCTHQPTCRALKPRSCSRLHQWMVHAWEVFNWWTGALVDQLKNEELFRINFFLLLFFSKNKYGCFYPNWSKDSVSPLCGIFLLFKLSHSGCITWSWLYFLTAFSHSFLKLNFWDGQPRLRPNLWSLSEEGRSWNPALPCFVISTGTSQMHYNKTNPVYRKAEKRMKQLFYIENLITAS